MPVFVDPNTGERYDSVPDDEVERARSEFGLVPESEWAARQKYEALSPLEKAGDVATAGLQGIARASMAPGMALQYAITGDKKALESPRHPDSAFAESVFSPEAAARKERHPFTAGVGEAVPSMLAGGGLGGAAVGLGLAPALGGLAAESALAGVSQEAVDSVTAKRAFSGSAALMNGGIDLALSGLTFGLSGGFSGLRRGVSKGAGTAAGEAVDAGLPAPRTLLDEVDPGEVPEAIGASRRRARSVGAAAAENAPHRVDPRTGRSLSTEAANDVATFEDDLFDASAKELRDGNQGKGMVREARFLAENREALTELAAQNTADRLDDVGRIMKDDVSLRAKYDDLQQFEGRWTPEQRAAQARWAKEAVESEAETILRQVEASQKAAADVRAGRSGARQAGVDAIDAGGIDARIQKTLRLGLDQVRRAEGAAKAEAVDHLKRGVGTIVRDIGRSGSLDEGTKVARTELLSGFYEKLQKGLESEEIFGGFGALQRDTNAALTELIEAQGRLDARLTERLGDTWGATGQQAINRRTVASKVASVMRAGPLEQRELMRDVADVLEAKKRLVEARRTHGVTHNEHLDRLETGLREFADDLKFARTLQVAERVAKDAAPSLGERVAGAGVDLIAGRVPVIGGALKKEGQGLLDQFTRAAALPPKGTALRAALDGRLKAYSRNPDLGDIGYSGTLPQWLQGALRERGGQVAGVGGLVGAGALLAPGEAGAAELLPDQSRARGELEAQLSTLMPEERAQQIQTAERFARIAQQVDSRVKGSVRDLFALARDPKAQPSHRSPKARELDRRAAELDVPRHMARFLGKHDDPVAAWKEKSGMLARIVADPAALARSMAERMGELPRRQPEIFASMVAQTMATAEYLHERMPGVAGRSALDPQGYPPTFEEISEWAGHWVGATAPLDSLDDLASNDLVPEQMEAVQALWPDGYAMFQTAAMAEIHALSKKKGTISLEALEQIDGALDLDGAGEPILSSAFADLLRQAEAQDAETKQTQGPEPQPPMTSQSPQRIASSALGSLHPQ